MSATKDKMMKAKQLIQAQRYPEARRILESVDHPTATKWLAQLDDIELGNPFASTAAKPGNDTPAEDLPNFHYLLMRDIVSLLLFPLSLLWITWDARKAQRAVKQYGAEAVPGAMALIYFNRFTFSLILLLPVFFLLLAVLTRP